MELQLHRQQRETRTGLLYGLGAYGFWGLMPLYFHAVRAVAPKELLAQRIVWSLVLLALIMSASQGWGRFVQAIREPRTRRTLVLTTVLIAINWYLYIFASATNRIVEASLGYFIAPLVSTALGVVLLKERLRIGQIMAIVVAMVGVIALTVLLGRVPWLGLGLAFSFSVYGLLRKTVKADSLTGLTFESMLLTPISLAYILYGMFNGESVFLTGGWKIDLLLIAGGAITFVPLFCFAQAARRLRLTTLGFLQYLSPTGQLLIAVFVLHEPFDQRRLIGFGFIWLALAIYTVDALLQYRRRQRG